MREFITRIRRRRQGYQDVPQTENPQGTTPRRSFNEDRRIATGSHSGVGSPSVRPEGSMQGFGYDPSTQAAPVVPLEQAVPVVPEGRIRGFGVVAKPYIGTKPPEIPSQHLRDLRGQGAFERGYGSTEKPSTIGSAWQMIDYHDKRLGQMMPNMNSTSQEEYKRLNAKIWDARHRQSTVKLEELATLANDLEKLANNWSEQIYGTGLTGQG